jgi:hypothetical protein
MKKIKLGIPKGSLQEAANLGEMPDDEHPIDPSSTPSDD